MSQPPPYVRFQDYSDYQITHQLPGPALSGADFDADFDRLKTTLDAVLANLALIQRDDGALNNATVQPSSLSSAVLTMLAGWNPRGAWLTATAYAVKDMVANGASVYVCLVAHVAGVFATDLAAAKWQLISTKGDQGIQGLQGLQGIQGVPGLNGSNGAAGAPGVTRSSLNNRVINGDFSIDQRNEGAAKVFAAGANVAYCVDRWYATCGGNNLTGQRVAGTGVNQFAYQFTGIAANANGVFGTRIESFHAYDLVNSLVTVQVWLSSTSIATVNWKVFSANTTDSWGTKSSTGGGTETFIDGGSIAITSTPTFYTFQTNLGPNAGRGIDLEFSWGPLLAGQTLKIEAVQLEKGALANPFDIQDFETRLRRCERYFEKSYDIGAVPGSVGRQGAYGGWANAAGTAVITGSYRTPKRATPAITFYAPQSGTSGKIRDVTAGADITATLAVNGMKGFEVSNGSATTASNFHETHVTADAEL
jgi:hypothetical protein